MAFEQYEALLMGRHLESKLFLIGNWKDKFASRKTRTREVDRRLAKSYPNKKCIIWESNPGNLLGRQIFYH